MVYKNIPVPSKNTSVSFSQFFRKYRFEIIFLFAIYLLGLYLTLLPRLKTNPHLLTFNANIWYRLAISQYFYDHGHLSQFSIRYLPYAHVPEWYPPLFPTFLAILAKIAGVDLPTACSRIMPFLESLTPLSLFLLARYVYGRRVAVMSTLALSLTTAFVYWNNISSPQSFISFMIPMVILIWVWYTKNLEKIGKRWLFILAFGTVLGFSFLVHLMYLLMITILLLVHLSLLIEKKAALKTTVDLAGALLVSQIVTIWWWLPGNLYWWWINGLVTSSTGHITFGKLYEMYGPTAFAMGLASFLFVIFSFFGSRNKAGYLLLPVFWTIIPLLETQNEAILLLIHKRHLGWSPLFKPLEGFRFHPFLAQPFALCVGITITLVAERLKRLTRTDFYVICAVLLSVFLLYDVKVIAKLDKKLRNAGITINEYQGAVWFKDNSGPDDLITADYYRSQMITGVCGGKAVDSLPFPLRNTDVKYISVKESGKTCNDIYTIYSTPSAEKASGLMLKYGFTHVFISPLLDKCGKFMSSFHKGFGAQINRGKFKDTRFFDIVYNNKGVMVIKRK